MYWKRLKHVGVAILILCSTVAKLVAQGLLVDQPAERPMR